MAPSEETRAYKSKYELGKLELTDVFGMNLFEEISDRIVVDFGCRVGVEAVQMAFRGAKRVIGIDIQERFLERGARLARKHGLQDRCIFVQNTDEKADIVVSKDAFEHFCDPAGVLLMMRGFLKEDGYVLATIGPTWYHPYRGHLFSVFPWAHIFFTEKALIRWRADFKSDGALAFTEVEGGLNGMTIRKFESIVLRSPFRFEYIETVPIKGIKALKKRFVREIGSSRVRCKLVPKA